MSALADFFYMDGYAVYVWISYGLSGLGSALLVWLTVTRRAAATARLKRLEALEAACADVSDVAQTDEDAA